MWIVNALVISVFGLVELLILANALNSGEPTAEHTWNELFLPLYAGLGFYALYVLAVFVWVCTGCSKRRTEDDDNDVVDYSVGQKPELDAGELGERWANGSDAVFDVLLIGLLIASVAVLAHTLEQPVPSWGPLFALLITVEVLYIISLVVGSVQTYVLHHAPTQRASAAATLFAGVLCCCSTAAARRALEDEKEAIHDQNADSDVAIQERYDRRAEFQDRPCVYLCTPGAAPNATIWILGAIAWLLPFALLATTILLYKRLAAMPAPLEAVELTRVFMGRRHHIATAAPRPLELMSGVLPLLVVLLPLFVAEGLLLLQAVCLCFACCVQGRTFVEWMLGLFYGAWLIAAVVFQAKLVERFDNPPEQDDSWHSTFAPLYLLFIPSIVVLGIIVACCTPPTYEPERQYVSKWGFVVYKK